MIENITLGQLSLALAFFIGIITSFKFFMKELQIYISKILQPINKKIDNLELNSIKTDLVNFMCLAEKNDITREQKMNAYELYDKYSKLGGNSYVHDKWEKLRKEGKL